MKTENRKIETTFFERIIQGFRYMFTAKLPKKEAKYISDYMYIQLLIPKGARVDSMSESVRRNCATVRFANEMEYITQLEFELYAKVLDKPRLIHFQDLVCSPHKELD